MKHDSFSSFNQADHCFLASLLPLPSSLLKLPNCFLSTRCLLHKAAWLACKTSNCKQKFCSIVVLFTANEDILVSITAPVVTQPLAFTDALLDPASREVMDGLASEHPNGERLQQKLRQTGTQLQQKVYNQTCGLNEVGCLLKSRIISKDSEDEFESHLSRITHYL